MRIVMVNLTGGGLSGGYRKYLRAVVPRLRAEARVCGLDVFAPPTVVDELRAAGLGPIETWPGDDARRGFASLTAALRSLRPDVVFIPTARALPGLEYAPGRDGARNMEPLEQPLAGLGPRAALVNLARAFRGTPRLPPRRARHRRIAPRRGRRHPALGPSARPGSRRVSRRLGARRRCGGETLLPRRSRTGTLPLHRRVAPAGPRPGRRHRGPPATGLECASPRRGRRGRRRHGGLGPAPRVAGRAPRARREGPVPRVARRARDLLVPRPRGSLPRRRAAPKPAPTRPSRR